MGQAADGEDDIEFVGNALGGDGFGVAFAVGPEAVAVGAVGGEEGGGWVDEGFEEGCECGCRVGGTGAFEQEVAGVGSGEWCTEPGVAQDEREAFGEEDLCGFEGGDGGTNGADDFEGCGDRGEPDEGDGPGGAVGDEAEADAGDDGEGAFAAGEKAWQVVAGVVFEEAGKAGEGRAIGEDCFESDELVAHGAIADDADAAGVGGDHASDGGGGAGGEVDPDVPAGGAHVLLEAFEGDASSDGDLTGDGVEVFDGVEAAEREDGFAGAGDATADEAGVAALGHEGNAGFAAALEDAGDLAGICWTNDEGGAAAEAAGPVGFVGGAGFGVVDDVGGPDDPLEAGAKGWVHAGKSTVGGVPQWVWGFVPGPWLWPW